MVLKGDRTAADAARLFKIHHRIAVVRTRAAFQDGLFQVALKDYAK
jgi:hypothetical protein